VDHVGGFSALVEKGITPGDRALMDSILRRSRRRLTALTECGWSRHEMTACRRFLMVRLIGGTTLSIFRAGTVEVVVTDLWGQAGSGVFTYVSAARKQ